MTDESPLVEAIVEVAVAHAASPAELIRLALDAVCGHVSAPSYNHELRVELERRLSVFQDRDTAQLVFDFAESSYDSDPVAS